MRSIGHFDFRQRLRVKRRIFGDEPIQIEDIGRDRIDFVRRQRLRRVERHGAAHEVKQASWRKANSFRRSASRLCRNTVPKPPASRSIGLPSPLAPWHAAHFVVVDRATLRHVAVARGKSRAVRRNVDVPACDLLWRRCAAEAVGLAGEAGGGNGDHGSERGQRANNGVSAMTLKAGSSRHSWPRAGHPRRVSDRVAMLDRRPSPPPLWGRLGRGAVRLGCSPSVGAAFAATPHPGPPPQGGREFAARAVLQS